MFFRKRHWLQGHRDAYVADLIGLNEREFCQFLGNNRIASMQCSGAHTRESELITDAE